ncbi:MAG: metal-dependent hydrolase [Steroidobacteraceae bacterium]
MDNITHTLIGAMVGDTADRTVPASAGGLPPRMRRMIGLGLMIIGSNLPDADFLYSAATGSKLDYLLQHRGYTHTVLGAVVFAALALTGLALWLRSRHIPWSSGDSKYLFALALLAPLLHIALDFTNSYGVHPFWPVRNDWFYGDAVFIVEPLLWATAVPLVFTLRTRTARALAGVAVAAGVVLSFTTGLVPAALAVVLTCLVLLLACISRIGSARAALAAGLATWLGITTLFVATGAAANARLSRLLTDEFPLAVTLDRVLTPMPVNPVCREVFAVQIEGNRYIVRKATLTLLPDWLPASECPQRALGSSSTAPLTATDARSTAEIAWLGEFAMGKEGIGDLAQRSCMVNALLKFARVPWAMQSGANWIVGDLRYDREPELGLAELKTNLLDEQCPAHVPPWTPPRADLLDPGAG